MATYTKEFLSGSTNGRNIKVAATGSPGTAIHQAHVTAKDEVYLWACNTHTTAIKLTLELGGTTSPDDNMEITLAPESGWVPILPGVPYSGGVIVRAFAGLANLVNIAGFVNRIS